MKTAAVAVITRTKNRTILLRRAIESVLGQTFQDWRMVIVNDGGSPAEIDRLVDEYRERFAQRIDVIHHETSRGMEAASNAGIAASDSDFLIIHDDDDAWDPRFLEETVGYLRAHSGRRELGGVVAHSVVVEESIEEGRVCKLSESPFNPWMKTVTLYRMAAGNIFPPISFLFRRQVLNEIGPYREDLPVLGDWDFHLRFVSRYEIGVVPKPLAFYHHRRALMNGEYSNTVVGGDHNHKYFDAKLRNELLRKDIEEGKLGLGLLVNVSRSFEDLYWVVNAAAGREFPIPPPTLFSYLKDRIYNLGKRAGLIRD